MADEILIVCAPADSPMAPAGSIFTRACYLCGARLMLAPSGQQFVKDHPEAKTICRRCVPENATVDLGKGPPLEDIVRDVLSAIPNPYRNLN